MEHLWTNYFAVNVAPYPLHVIPVGDNAVLHGVPDAKQATVLLRLGSNEYVALQRTSHHSDMLGPANAAGEGISSRGS